MEATTHNGNSQTISARKGLQMESFYFFINNKNVTYMAFTTKVITDTSPVFGDNPQTITESGQPSSVNVENLASNTGYWTKAEIWQDGVLNDTSSVENFQTLPAGTITLTHQSSVRSGSNYVVTFTYTSTYALSSSVLVCGISNSTQGVIAGNTITFTVSGLVPGDAYIAQVTTIDIYSESAQNTLSLVMPEINQVSITGTTATDTTVECELDYIIEGGFTEGYIDYWYASDDPAVDPPIAHDFFDDGDTSCTITGLTEGTAYIFRATIYYGGHVNYTQSSFANATTVADYDRKYFTITNIGNSTASVYYYKTSSTAQSQTISVSTDNGATWTNKTSTTNPGVKLADLASGNSVLLKKSVASNGSNAIYTTGSACELSGNIASMCFGDNYNTGSTLTMPNNAFKRLFVPIYNVTSTITKANNVSFASFTAISESGCDTMFSSLTRLTSVPDLSCITSVDNFGMLQMFNHCSALTTPPDLSNITTVNRQGMTNMFNHCTALVTPPDLSGVTRANASSFYQMFYECYALTSAPDLSNITYVDEDGMSGMFGYCSALTAPPDLSNITTIGNGGMGGMFRGCTSLATAPDLKSVTSIGETGMVSMFEDCSALTAGPDISNITSVGNRGIETMFRSCTQLTSAYTPNITTWPSGGTGSWLYNVASSGTLYVPTQQLLDAIPENSANGCPSGWTKQLIS